MSEKGGQYIINAPRRAGKNSVLQAIKDIETAVSHLEAFISGGDELGDVSEDDAIAALRFLEGTIQQLQGEADTNERFGLRLLDGLGLESTDWEWTTEGADRAVHTMQQIVTGEITRAQLYGVGVGTLAWWLLNFAERLERTE